MTATLTPRVVAAARVSPHTEDVELPGVPGFVVSSFNPLVRETVRRCLGEPGTLAAPNRLTGPYPDSTAIVLATVAGDATTSDVASQKLVSGRVHNPLLFFQSVTTSILGHLTIEYGITGPVSCIAADSGVGEQALDAAELLLRDEDIDQVLVIAVELAVNPRTEAAFGHLAVQGGTARPPEGDLAVALLLRRPGEGAGTELCPGRPGPEGTGHLRALAALADRIPRP
ncbi:beta-ketoacyl synthase-like protein [Streptomyces sp. 2132.2]|uniref:beta-ketoacyl synthase N-terminal-like domain-containing protein n=1 Tax=Streptomyces TaxID=1883 RepID=UPI000F999142|nr:MULTISPECIES: beta-ketoacyl synthase chain length factor [unclassified Streptomyces]ROQ89064.1 beta-ketoacyl synthase-like protein [Streptomyces sp. 2132.2]WSI29237.1 beta-ketoacyl synthase chain length factor [Streptomyces sp. NBC_01343]